ncbi:MAG: hypothetical protein KDA49_10210 [Rhodospirillaceae bacterium]|nr:hypothetical protein [Rhodospirillaceae bacterium]
METSDWIALIAAAAAVVSAAMASILAIVGVRQLQAIAAQITAAGDQQKKLASLRACERYDTDPIIEQATKSIWDKRLGPNDYSNARAYQRDIINLLNYLDSLAIGVEQDLYAEDIVRAHMEPVVTHAVKTFLKVEPCLFNRDDLQPLIRLFDRWQDHPIRDRDPA